ncbi:Acetyl-CoA acetyltransferase [Gaiella occulta]|uniref:Acetyl-CoA acetyltransferase n=1 Tax=Gaiella occulta TaxID=1002870 RepID=A0A7M2YTW3_9ACTN|nr:Acetyl-CoA acetyltransferase [Gaiella occulta]
MITGVAESPYARHPGSNVTTRTVLVDAARRALADAGLAPADIDGLGVASFSLAPDHAIDLAVSLGLRVRWLMDSANGGASAIEMLQHARSAVEAEDAKHVLLVAGDRLNPDAFVRLVDEYNSATRDYLSPLPTGGPNVLFAMLTQRHMKRHQIGREEYGKLVVTQRSWAQANPGAVYREPMTLDEYLRAPIVADPLSIFDCVPVVTGANAIVVSGEATGSAVRVRALKALHNHDGQDGDGLDTGLGEIAPELWHESGIGPGDVDVVSVYDDYPAMALVQLEDLGFADDGDIRRLIEQRLATRELPVNTSGGQLSAGQAGAAGGMHGLVEVVGQLRGTAGSRQIRGARVGVVSGYGMVAYRYGACANAAVLEKIV